MPILGTAGHIDHGKTALIKALTGFDTDRLREEKERGISIDLGFAPFDVEGDERAGVVDVPGHERFIRNMLAGAHGIDLVLLVVAADDGVMPQTEEHLDILHLLGVQHGIIALTKIDLADEARRREVREDIEILLADTSLEESPVFDVSAITGEGIAELHAALAAALHSLEPARSEGFFRLPVDRSFVIRGHGTVVTGTATAGSIEAAAAVRILPGDLEARVRSVQVHGNTVTRAQCGERIALNLAGIEHQQVNRGQVVCDSALDRVTDRFDAFVELRPAARRPLPRHSLVRVYVGTAEVMGKILYLDGRDELAPKETTYAQLVLREPIAAFGGDRFILREQTARTTIGGGVILHPFARKPRRRVDPRLPHLVELHGAVQSRQRLDALLALDEAFAVATNELAAAANLRSDEVRVALADHHSVRPLPNAAAAEAYTTEEKWARLRDAVSATLSEFHRAQPRQPGMEMESLRSQLAAALAPKVFRAVIAELQRSGVLVRDESLVRLPSHSPGLNSAERAVAERIVAALTEAGFTPPDLKAIQEELRIEPQALGAILDQLEREDRIGRADAKLVFAAEPLERARQLVRRHVAEHGQIDAAQFRDLIGASRKFSIALLNYFDRTGFTMRIGDVRKLREKRP
jgi:selenocysteine-specific elongation factor